MADHPASPEGPPVAAVSAASRRGRLSLAAGVLGLCVGAGAVVAGFQLPSPAPAAVAADLGSVGSTDATGPRHVAADPADPTTPVPPDAEVPTGAPPVTVGLPRLGVVAPLVPAGVLADGQLQLPDDPGTAGWWAAGPAPGEPGSVLVGGHVETAALGRGALAALHEVAAGDLVVLTDSLGATHEYTVESRRSYPKADLPVEVLVAGADAAPALVLVTCGGEVDPVSGRYADNVVVVARPVDDGRVPGPG